MLASDMRDVIAKMNALKSHGLSLSLDDFGTGYSSLSYLKHLPLEKIENSLRILVWQCCFREAFG